MGASSRPTLTAYIVLLIGIVIATIAPAQDPNEAREGQEPTIAERFLARIQAIEAGWMEAMALVLVIVFFINYLRGKQQNSEIALAWFLNVKPILERQFAKIGAYQRVQGRQVLIKDSQSQYRLYSSGRRNCSGLLASIDLKKRQDLTSFIMDKLGLVTEIDRCVIEVPMETDCVEPFAFMICKRRDERKLRKENKDIENFTKKVSTSALTSSNLSVLTETSDVIPFVLDSRVVKALCENQDLMISLHITDSSSVPLSLSPAMLRLEFALPSLQRMHRIKKLLEMAIFLIDQTAATTLTLQNRNRAVAARAKAAEVTRRLTHDERQEELKRKKIEALERERSSLTGEALLRFEEKQEKLALKRRGPKMKIMR